MYYIYMQISLEFVYEIYGLILLVQQFWGVQRRPWTALTDIKQS